MARPTKPKDLKPAEGAEAAEGGGKEKPAKGGGPGLDLKFIVTIMAIFLCSIGSAVGAMYFLAPMILVPAIVAKLPKAEGAGAEGEKEGAHKEAEKPKVGMNLELDEFTDNLKKDPDMSGSQFVRAKMALSVTAEEKEDCNALLEKKAAYLNPSPRIATVRLPVILADGVIAGAAAGISNQYLAEEAAASPYDTCMHEFKEKMGHYVPTIRDIINAALMKRTAGQLATPEGQEALKDDIKDQINQVLAEGYKVVRVNFQDFIIQR